jgi:hypothetical protein
MSKIDKCNSNMTDSDIEIFCHSINTHNIKELYLGKFMIIKEETISLQRESYISLTRTGLT